MYKLFLNRIEFVVIVKTFLRSFFFSLTLVRDSANLFNPQSSSTETRVFHETGCIPPPLNHSWRTFVLMSFTFFPYLFSKELILDLLVSSRRSAPNSKYFVPISWAMFSLVVPSAWGKARSSPIVTWSGDGAGAGKYQWIIISESTDQGGYEKLPDLYCTVEWTHWDQPFCPL